MKAKKITNGYETIFSTAELHPYLTLVHKYSKQSKEGYTEVHHIVPVSMGGGDEYNNLVRLTFAEHLHVHWVLAECLRTIDKKKGFFKMVYAFQKMLSPNGRKVKYPKGVNPSLWKVKELIKENV